MDKAKPVSTPLGAHFRLSSSQSTTNDKEKTDMARIPYASAVGSLMYVMVCTRPNLAHSVRIVSRFYSNQGKNTSKQSNGFYVIFGDHRKHVCALVRVNHYYKATQTLT